MNYSVFGKYAHLYWIPFIPIGKVNIVECNNCKATYDVKELEQRTKDKFKQEMDRNPAKTPVKHFSAPILIVLIIAGSFLYSSFNDNEMLNYAKNPKVGDVYYYETPEKAGHYSTLKITEITKDSIFGFENNMGIDSKDQMDKILDAKNYTYPFAYSKAEMKDITKDLEVFFKITRE
ncbi:hypothetical protein ACFSX9_11740 [Flavobacterium ardleyense]|uniref:Uncharacterized protein n=1 Tax=Flavobacterium ardleyense TaxID=2038737 RepID=A0ABW5ZA61_9FLAO